MSSQQATPARSEFICYLLTPWVVCTVFQVRQGRRPERDKLLQMQNSPNLSRRALPGALLTRSGASSGGNLVAEKYTLVPDAAEEFRRMS